MTQRQKKSFLAGALTSSAGIFISKAIGLLYVVPFTAMAGEGNMFFYSQAYTLYDFLLQICSAGFPFAIAAMVAKYSSVRDYKTVLVIKKLSASILLVAGFTMAVIFAAIAGPYAGFVLGKDALASDVHTMQITFMILALAVAVVPYLSSFRSFYQGLKELKVYAASQVIEQIARVVALLGLGALTVYLLKMDQIWAIYMAVLATSLAAGVTILYYRNFDKKHIGPIRAEAREQEQPPRSTKELVHEMLAFGLPFLAVSILAMGSNLINNNFFMGAMEMTSTSYEDAKLILGIFHVQCLKLVSIPQVLALGFSTGIVPYLTVALEQKNFEELRNNITQCLDAVCYIGTPLCFCLFALAKPIYYVMYGGTNLDLSSELLQWSSLYAITGLFYTLSNSMMMTLRFRKKSLIYLGVGLVIKVVTFFGFIATLGYNGLILSSVANFIAVTFLNLQLIQNRYQVSYKRTCLRFLRILLCCLAMNGAFALLNLVGLDPTQVGRLLGVCELAVYGIVGVLVYGLCTSWLKIPQAIFHLSMKDVLKRLFSRGNHAQD